MTALSAMPMAAVAQSVVTNPNHALKLIVVGRRKPGTTLAEHRQHIRRVHGEIVLRYIAADPSAAPQRYAQHQVFDGQFRASAPGTDPLALNRDFITQIWFKDMAALTRSRETAFYKEQLMGDEDNFVDQKTVVFMPTRERVLWSRAAGAPQTTLPGSKLFFFVQRAPGADAAAFQRVWAQGAAELRNAPLAGRIARHVQNDVLSRPGAASPADGIDEFWVDDEASARALLQHWQSWVRTALVQPGLVAEGTPFGLLAQEDLIHAGSH